MLFLRRPNNWFEASMFKGLIKILLRFNLISYFEFGLFDFVTLVLLCTSWYVFVGACEAKYHKGITLSVCLSVRLLHFLLAPHAFHGTRVVIWNSVFFIHVHVPGFSFISVSIRNAIHVHGGNASRGKGDTVSQWRGRNLSGCRWNSKRYVHVCAI